MTDLSKLTKAQLIELLQRKQQAPYTLFLQRDTDVPEDSTKKNAFWGYITIPEGVHGEFRLAGWMARDMDGNPIPGRIRATFKPKAE